MPHHRCSKTFGRISCDCRLERCALGRMIVAGDELLVYLHAPQMTLFNILIIREHYQGLIITYALTKEE